MEPLVRITSAAAVLPGADIDTDIIFPARFLLITAKKGLGRYAFYEKRYDRRGEERPEFPLNHEPARSAQIFIVGDNFGCGSSREQAVWALHDLGCRVILATGFGEIFYSNCFKSGVLPVILSAETLQQFRAAAERGETLTVDLKKAEISVGATSCVSFKIEDWRREALLEGWDEVLMLINTQAAALATFERRHRAAAPWLFAAD